MRAFVFVSLGSCAFVGLVGACTDQVNPSFESSSRSDASSDGARGDATGAPVDAGAPDGGDGGDASDDGGGRGAGTITGSVGGAAFGPVMSAFWIGMPDVAATTAVYLIGAPVACADITSSGWSHTIPANIKIFEMILQTRAPAAGSYTVSAGAPPVGGAEVQYIVSSPVRNETRATSGSISLTALTPNTAATGTFGVQFLGAGDAGDAGDAGASMLSGTFNAVYCAAAHEP